MIRNGRPDEVTFLMEVSSFLDIVCQTDLLFFGNLEPKLDKVWKAWKKILGSKVSPFWPNLYLLLRLSGVKCKNKCHSVQRPQCEMTDKKCDIWLMQPLHVMALFDLALTLACTFYACTYMVQSQNQKKHLGSVLVPSTW